MSAKWYRPWDSREEDERKWEAESRVSPEEPEASSDRSAAGSAGADDAAETWEGEIEAEPLEQVPDQEQQAESVDVIGQASERFDEPGDRAWQSPESVDRSTSTPPRLTSGVELPRRPLGWNGKPTNRGLVKPDEAQLPFSPHERLLILDTWQRSGLPAGDFGPLVGVSKHTLYMWKKRFAEHGPAGLADRPRGTKTPGKLSEVTRRTIVMLKQAHPEWGCQRISDELVRGPALAAGASAVARVLHEAGYQSEERVTRPHRDKLRRFERARPNQLWQTDLFTFVLKRQNRRLYLVGFMDDHSRFVVGYGLHASASGALVLEVLRSAIASYGPPEEILTDNGPQYVTWRGKSQFSRELEQQGIRQIVSRPKHPQTLGKIERFWGTLWRECLQRAVFLDLEDARRRIGLFIDHYNFQRPHQGLEGATPADRFFHAAPTVLATLQERVASNALELARQGVPRSPFYMTGQVAGQPFSVHAEGERVFLTRAGQPRQEVELVGPQQADQEETLPEPLCPHGAPESSDQLANQPPGDTWPESAPPLKDARMLAGDDAWRANPQAPEEVGHEHDE
jgi:transposase InsO family protein